MARADRRRATRTSADAGFERKYESAYVGTEGLFFQRLRTHAKWVFVFLALSFGLGFVAFGVGSDVQGGLDQLFQGRAANAGPDVGDARERAQDNPRDPAAQLAYAEALQQAGEAEEAIPPLRRYLTMRPRDEEALQLLANLYLTKAERLQEQAAVAQTEAAMLDPGREFRPSPQTPLGQAVQSQSAYDPAGDADERVTAAYQELQTVANQIKTTHQRIATLSPSDPVVQLQLAEAAQNAGDVQLAVTAYKRFLRLAPDDPVAPDVRERVKALEASAAAVP